MSREVLHAYNDRLVLRAYGADNNPASATVGCSVTHWKRPMTADECREWVSWRERCALATANTSPSYGDISHRHYYQCVGCGAAYHASVILAAQAKRREQHVKI